MTDARMIELEPDAGESMRRLKVNVSRAAKEVSRPVEYGETETGTLLVWLRDRPKQTRGPRAARQRGSTTG